MDNIIKDAISDSWCNYQEQTFGWIEEESAHNHGWKEGYEWILTELSTRGYISDEIVERYMNALCVSLIRKDLDLLSFQRYVIKHLFLILIQRN